MGYVSFTECKQLGFNGKYPVGVGAPFFVVHLSSNPSRTMNQTKWGSVFRMIHVNPCKGFPKGQCLLGGGFKYCLFSPLPGEMIQFD